MNDVYEMNEQSPEMKKKEKMKIARRCVRPLVFPNRRGSVNANANGNGNGNGKRGRRNDACCDSALDEGSSKRSEAHYCLPVRDDDDGCDAVSVL